MWNEPDVTLRGAIWARTLANPQLLLEGKASQIADAEKVASAFPTPKRARVESEASYWTHHEANGVNLSFCRVSN